MKKLGLSFAMLIGATTLVDAQCNSWESYPSGVQSAKEQHVIYTDLYKSKKYAEAFPIWKDLFAHVQAPKEAKSRHFQDGIQMYKEFAAVEKDAAKKKEYTAEMVKLYDMMAECLGENALDRAYEASYLYYLRGDANQVVKLFEKSMKLGDKKTPSMVLAPMAQLTVYLFKYNQSLAEEKRNPKYTAEYMRNLYDKLKELAEYNIANNKKEAAQYQTGWDAVVKEYDKIGGIIWGCDFYVEKWKPAFEANPNNMEQNAEIIAVIKEKCGEENEFYQQVDVVYRPWIDSVILDSLKTAFDGLCNLDKGKFRMRQSQKAKKAGNQEEADKLEVEAFDWYEKSLDDPITEDCNTTTEEKGELAYKIAYRKYRAGSYSSARSLCYKAVEFKKGWGEPYMLIGTMYASSGKRCSGGKGTGFEAQVVAWAAMDMWQKAKSVDPSLAGKANSQIAKYKKYLPTKGDLFQRGLKPGGSYKIGCWIGVTTTIRAGGQ